MNLPELLYENKNEIISFFAGAIVATIIVVFVIERNNLRWGIKELIKLYSGEPSYFSKKRIESGVAFSFAFWMTVYYLRRNIDGMDIWSFGYVLTVWLFIAGYTVQQIQREKGINVGASGAGAGNGNNNSA
jgi:hypothetical protein